jgi:choline transport protein
MFLSGSTMQALILATQPDYQPKAYQGYLFVVMVATFALFVNTFLARFLPSLENIVLALFILAFIATEAVLWALGPRLTAGEFHRLGL